jgi:hypothetical protein
MTAYSQSLCGLLIQFICQFPIIKQPLWSIPHSAHHERLIQAIILIDYHAYDVFPSR